MARPENVLEQEAYVLGGDKAAAIDAMALVSMAVTFKRVVDLFEPIARAALAELERELKEKGKAK